MLVDSKHDQHYSPAQAANLLGLNARRIRGELNAARLDARRRVIEGPWAGAWRRGSHWRIPATALARQLHIPQERVDFATTDAIASRLAAVDRALAQLAAALAGGALRS